MRIGSEQIKQNISEIFSNSIKQDLDEETKNDIQKAKNILTTMRQWEKILEQQSRQLNIAKIDNIQQQRYIETKIALNQYKEELQLESTLKEAYRLIDQLYQKYSGKKAITYSIGIEYYGKYYEGTLDLEQILSLSKLDINWSKSQSNSIKLTLQNNRSRIIDMMKATSVTTQNQNKYNTIFSLARKRGIKNKGRIYEVYRQLRNQSNQSIEQNFDSVLAQKYSDTAAFYTGGDKNNIQYKYFADSSPSLASINSLRQVLQAFVISIAQGASLNQIKQIFNKDYSISNFLETGLVDTINAEIDKSKKI